MKTPLYNSGVFAPQLKEGCDPQHTWWTPITARQVVLTGWSNAAQSPHNHYTLGDAWTSRGVISACCQGQQTTTKRCSFSLPHSVKTL